MSKHFRKFQRSSTLPRRDKQVESQKKHFFRWLIMKRLDFSRNEGTKKKKLVGHFVWHLMAYSNIWFTYKFLFVFLLVYVRNYFTHTFSFLCRRTQNLLQRQETFGWELDEHHQQKSLLHVNKWLKNWIFSIFIFKKIDQTFSKLAF